MTKKLTTNEFIDKAKQKHGETYDYSLIDYMNAHSKVTIICKIHGKFSQKASAHLWGYGCSMCGGTQKLTNLK